MDRRILIGFGGGKEKIMMGWILLEYIVCRYEIVKVKSLMKNKVRNFIVEEDEEKVERVRIFKYFLLNSKCFWLDNNFSFICC